MEGKAEEYGWRRKVKTAKWRERKGSGDRCYISTTYYRYSLGVYYRARIY